MMGLMLSGCEADRNAIYGSDKEIAKADDNHLTDMSVYSLESSELSMTARGFTGAKTLWRYTAQSDEDVALSYSLTASGGGKAKLVLISPANEVTVLAEYDGSTETDGPQTQTVPLSKGSSRIKVVGVDGASFTLVLGADVGELVNK